MKRNQFRVNMEPKKYSGLSLVTITLLLTILPTFISTQTCSPNGFFCVAGSSTFQDCLNEVVSPTVQNCTSGTVCSMACEYPCITSTACPEPTPPPAKCNADNFYCIPGTSNSFSQCVDDNPTPYPDVTECIYGICDMKCAISCSEYSCPECEEPGRYPIPEDVRSYYICSVNANNVTQYKQYRCPDGSVFDATLKKCVDAAITVDPTTEIPTTTITSTTVTTSAATTPAAFTCSKAGRFPDPSDCKVYYICSKLSSGGFSQYRYVCPGDSVFDSQSSQCSLIATCAQKSTTAAMTSSSTTSPPRFVCPGPSGMYEDVNNCKNYYLCVASQATAYSCPGDSLYNPVIKKCASAYVCTK